MNPEYIKNCPGTLAPGHQTFSTACLRQVFDKKKVSCILPYQSLSSEEDGPLFRENRQRISISGVQEKVSMLLDRNELRLTKEDEQGTYILKPIPRDLDEVDQVPANEHLTMQIARQIYKIDTAGNALVFFKDGSPAYLTKRFDIKPDGTRWGKEDFASLAGKTSDNSGPDFKYDYSYESIAELIRRYVPASILELEKFFSLLIFNYLFSNGDAHLKNFSVLQTADGDHILSPAYDLINTRIHVNDRDFALNGGLFKDNFESTSLKLNGWVGLADFHEFADRIGIAERRRDKLLAPFLNKQDGVEQLTSRSFLDEGTKKLYLASYEERLKKLS
ncbi:MAG: HipA domain-containing protein [Bacteroidota bacterium]